MAVAAVDVRRFTVEEYERLVEQGFFHPEEKIELVDGAIFEMTPQSSGHAAGVLFSQLALQPVVPATYHLRSQMPLALGLDSQPEPDLAVVLGHPRDYVAAHPTTAALVVEVADSSLVHDRQRKASLYARAGIVEYWLVDLGGSCLEVFREPREGAYASRAVLSPGDAVSPLAFAGSIAVRDLLPRA